MTLSTIGSVALIGAGKMGLALASGWLAAGLPASDLTLVDPNPSEITKAFTRDHGVALAGKAEGAARRVVVMAVKPQVINTVMPEVRPIVGADTLVLSIAQALDADIIERD